MVKFWVHTSSDAKKPIDGGGYEITLGKEPHGWFPSNKLTVWADKDAVLAFCHRHFDEAQVRDLGNRVEIDMPADAVGCTIRPARTLAFTLVEINN